VTSGLSPSDHIKLKCFFSISEMQNLEETKGNSPPTVTVLRIRSTVMVQDLRAKIAGRLSADLGFLGENVVLPPRNGDPEPPAPPPYPPSQRAVHGIFGEKFLEGCKKVLISRIAESSGVTPHVLVEAVCMNSVEVRLKPIKAHHTS
jgi:hypothetical protein